MRPKDPFIGREILGGGVGAGGAVTFNLKLRQDYGAHFVLLGIWENNTSRTVTKAKAMSDSLNAPARADSAPRATH